MIVAEIQFHTPRCNQGQTQIVSYGVGPRGMLYSRNEDWSMPPGNPNRVTYAVGSGYCPDDFRPWDDEPTEDSEGYPLRWVPIKGTARISE